MQTETEKTNPVQQTDGAPPAAWRRLRAAAAGLDRTAAARLALLPALFIFWEGVLHLYSGMALRYAPVWLAFALAAGCLLTAVTLLPRPRAGGALTLVLAGLLSLLYIAEIVAKQILQTYCPLSILGTAAGNRLSDYAAVIRAELAQDLPVILLLCVPVVVLACRGRRMLEAAPHGRRAAGGMLAAAVALHLFALVLAHLPWAGDLTPAQLYRMDINMDDQVEQLGLVTMLRLDVQHLLVPASGGRSDDFSGLDALGADDGAPEQAPAATATSRGWRTTLTVSRRRTKTSTPACSRGITSSSSCSRAFRATRSTRS